MVRNHDTTRDNQRVISDNRDSMSDLNSTVSRYSLSSLNNDVDNLPFPITTNIIIIFINSTLGGLLFGYDTGIISGILSSLKPQDLSRTRLTDFDKELVTSMTSIGSFFGSILGFPLADKFGRKKTLTICNFLFIFASLWMALSINLPLLILGRFFIGIAIGLSAQCVPIYLSELSPTNIRGRILAINVIAITSGQLFAYIISYLLIKIEPYPALSLESNTQVWRYLFGFSAIPALIFILFLDFMPESPRWLVLKGDLNAAHKSLSVIYSKAPSFMILIKLRKLIIDITKLKDEDTYPDSSQVAIEDSNPEQPLCSRQNSNNYEAIPHQNISNVGASDISLDGLRTLFSKDTKSFKTKFQCMDMNTKRALLIGCVLMFFQQITGFNAFMYYINLIFARINIENPLIPAIVVAFTNVLFTIVSMLCVDKIGRRTMLLYTILIMTVGLLMCSMAFKYDNPRLAIISTVIFVAAYAIAMGSIPWNSVELLPLKYRSLGASCISCTNWFTNSIISMSYLSIMNKIGNAKTMLIFATFTVLNWVFVYNWYPEVKGLSLEEIREVFQDGINVHYVYKKYNI
ncbi:hypothetical protein TPHA_0J02740 [Tetrapisispora phaffii CBS 4417]|uniref:Major facilitator superfamily (MFS) profile domain-containing protein n=1 Tax=Tetrapisispora phaffii (strain ATCC 24235 / CBS 4417 / NBRC 1672 / NRRL Y-8282 / UCD 70-5) TaxID=1071381 RepID=G8BZ03_TETPH|nr:hypothetical protein TPHA_0J02740 [Tetrapisispora phaffii CBS 4417]CCE65095.1 hypothetical protein TPHA_0J02740 [Tetrapisispora phaffii CBS 4417]